MGVRLCCMPVASKRSCSVYKSVSSDQRARQSLTFAVSHSARHSGRSQILGTRGCPSRSCPLCQIAPLVYLYHPQCRKTLHQTIIGEKLSDDGQFLQFAHAMSHHDRCTPTPRSLLDGFLDLFTTILENLSPHTPTAQFLPWLIDLPPELQLNIFSYLLDSPGGNVLFFKEALHVLQKLHKWPEGRRSVACKGPLFARWVAIKNSSYIAGVYDRGGTGFTEIKTYDDTWDHIVLRQNDVGIIDIAFVDSHSTPYVAAKTGYVEVIRRAKLLNKEEIWITLEVR
jgi:hypothetical protein